MSTITVKDIARLADVSVGTVSRVFNNHSNVTEDIRQRVLKAATDLGYSRSVSQNATRPAPRAIREIGYIYCSNVDTTAHSKNPFWSHILEGAEMAARKSAIKMTYQSVGELAQNPPQLLAALQEMKLGGLLLVGPSDLETILQIKSLNVPLVLIDNYVPGISVDAVLCDNFEGARAAVEYLIDAGHRQIAFIGGPVLQGARPVNRIYTLERRAAGYRTALLDAGLPVDYRLFEACNLSPEDGYEACKRLLARNEPFTAIFCANDSIALGAMKALREAGCRVPEDVSLIGFDDIDMVEHLTPALTTVRVDKEALGAVGVRSLLARIADPDITSVTSVVDVELVVRASVATLTR